MDNVFNMTTSEKTVRRLVRLNEAALRISDAGAREQVQHVADDLAGDTQGVSKAVAARALGLSVPTVEKWIDSGRLVTVHAEQSDRQLVDTAHLGRVAAVVRALRRDGRKRGVIAAVVTRLSEHDVATQASLTDALEESLIALERGELHEPEIPPDVRSERLGRS